MPVSYDLPRITGMWNQQDVNINNILPFFFANLSAKYYPYWTTWNKVVGSIPWQPNMGSTMKGVRAEPSPVGRSMFFPNPITQQPAKDVAEVRELTETAVVYRHLYETPYFNFLPSWQDFRKDQVNFALKDLAKQIMVTGQDMFIRSVIFHRSPKVFVVGNTNVADGGELIDAPVGDGNNAGTSGKTTAWLQAQAAKVGNAKGNLSFKVINKIGNILRSDIMAPPFEGLFNTIKDNETAKGKYLCIGDGEDYSQLSFDEFVLQYKDLNRNLLNDEFEGILSGFIAYKSERYALRMLDDGTFPVPELMEVGAGAYNLNETIPNPAYVSAPFTWHFFMGNEPYRAIAVGPPPKEFASGKMSESKFNKLQWNGEVRITDNLLINYGGGNLETNKYGEFLQLIASTVHGIIPVNRRFCIPVLSRRWRVQTT